MWAPHFFCQPELPDDCGLVVLVVQPMNVARYLAYVRAIISQRQADQVDLASAWDLQAVGPTW